MRTQKEILAQMKARAPYDPLGFETGDLLPFLDFAHAREFLVPDATPEKWAEACAESTDAAVRKRMDDYIEFAWDKCTSHRGISASRSIAHFRAWAWLIGDDEAVAFIDDEDNYAPYGAPILGYLSKRYGWAMPGDESTARMVAGESCVDGCDMGCGT